MKKLMFILAGTGMLLAACAAPATETIIVTATPEPTATEVPATATPEPTDTPEPTSTPDTVDGVWNMTLSEAREYLNEAGYSFHVPAGFEQMLVDATSGAPDCKLWAMQGDNSTRVNYVAVSFPGVNLTEGCLDLHASYFLDAGVNHEVMAALVGLIAENRERINAGDTVKGSAGRYEYTIRIDDGTLYIFVENAYPSRGP